jgi:hypothetical protein
MIKPLVIAYLHQRAAVIVMLLASCLLTGWGADDPAVFSAIVLGTALLSWTAVPSGINAFTCALPIRGGDLVMSRVMGAIAVAVVPTMIWAGMQWGADQTPATILMPGVQLAALAIALGVAAAGVWIHHTVPDALPLPLNERGSRKRVAARPAGTNAGAAWWSVVASALPPIYALYCVWLVGTAVVGSAAPFYCLVLLSLPGIIRHRSEWVGALPLSHRQRVQLIVLPTVVVPAACVALGRALRARMLAGEEPLSADYRLWLIDAAVLMMLGVMVVLLIEVSGALSRRRRGVVGFFLGELPTVAVAAVVVADLVPRMRGTEGIVAVATRMLHETAASSTVHTWSVLALAVTLLVTSCVLLEHQFRRSGTSGNADVQAA